MYILEHRSSWGTSRIRPSWSPSGIYWTQLCPHSGKRVSCCHACPEDAVYSLNASDSSFTQCLFTLWVASRWYTSEQHSTMYGTKLTFTLQYMTHNTHFFYTSHSCIHLYFLLYMSSVRRGRLTALYSWCPIHFHYPAMAAVRNPCHFQHPVMASIRNPCPFQHPVMSSVRNPIHFQHPVMASVRNPCNFQHPFVASCFRNHAGEEILIVCRACNLTWFSPCLTGPVD
jgi:hypothetical protein